MAGPLTIPITGGSVAAGGTLGGTLGGIGSVLSGIGAVGSLFGGGSDGIDVSENYRLAQALQDVEMEGHKKRFQAIRYGAKKAGLHPLFAMGAGVQSPSSQVIGGQPSSGGNAADALRKTGQAMMAWEQHKAALAESNARTRQTNAETDALEMSELRRMQANPQNDMPAKYIQTYNPLSGNVEWHPNPALNIELPESYGASLLGRATAKDWTGL